MTYSTDQQIINSYSSNQSSGNDVLEPKDDTKESTDGISSGPINNNLEIAPNTDQAI